MTEMLPGFVESWFGMVASPGTPFAFTLRVPPERLREVNESLRQP